MTGDETYDLGDLTDLAEGDMRCFGHVGSYGVVLARFDGDLFAFDDNCPACDEPLSLGLLVADQIICDTHESGFDVRDGTASASMAPLAVYRLDGPEHAVRVHLS